MSAPKQVSESLDAVNQSIQVPLGWLAFCIFILGSASVDLLIISRPDAYLPASLAGKLRSVPTFARQIAFWLLSGILFNMIIWNLLGRAAAGAWLYGYILEYVLSIDNLFVFQAVFRSYSTPSLQVERALFWGVSAAVLLRLVFFWVGTEMLSMGFLARCFFGLALIYSGIKTLRSSDEEDEDDPAKNPLVQCVARLLPVHDRYADEADFFVRVSEIEVGQPRPAVLGDAMDSPEIQMSEMGTDRSTPHSVAECVDVSEFHDRGPMPTSVSGKSRLKVTPLFLVVITLGIIDVVFAVDSVTAKISSITGWTESISFFINLSSSAFAMFVLRSLYTVVSILSSMFQFLGYGVGIVLVLLGVKLMLSGYVEIGMLASCATILLILLAAILASVVLPAPAGDSERSGRDLPVEEGGEEVDAGRAPAAEDKR